MLFRVHLYFWIFLLVLATGCASSKRLWDALFAASDDVELVSVMDNSDISSDLLKDTVVISEIIIRKVSAKKTNLLNRLKKEFRWNYLYSHKKRVQRELSLMRDNQAYVNKTFDGARKYLYFIADQISSNDMPIEIAFLPGVESQYNPLAYSFAHAAGMWQIIPSTAKHLGLRVNWWHDDRRDLMASTQAAIKYLKSMHKRFKGDWLLALAAYNSGPLRVERAIRKNRRVGKQTDYWSLGLPRETMRYVPRLIALLELTNTPKLYGVELPAIEDKMVFSSITVDSQIDLHRLSLATGYSMDELIAFNGGLNQRFTEPFGEYQLHVPVNLKDKVYEYLESDASMVDEYWISYKSERGESLTRIAEKFDTTTGNLTDINRLEGFSVLKANQYLLVPVDSDKLSHYSHYHDKTPDKIVVSRGSSQLYRLKRGDSLWALSKRFKISIEDLMRWNSITRKTRLYAGKSIYIKRTAYIREEPIKLQPALEHKLLSKVYYPVRSGDTLTSVANRFGVRMNDILAWNPVIRNKILRVNKTIILHVDVTRNY